MRQQPEDNSELSFQNTEMFRLIIENVKDYAIFMIDPEGFIVSWNPGVEHLLGYAENEIIGQSASIIFTPEDLAHGAQQSEMEVARQSGCAEDKRWHVRKDGSRFWANGMLSALKNADGTLRGFAKVMRDDTRQKQHEEALSESEERYRTLFNSIDQGFCILEMLFDENGKASDYRFADVNPVFEKMTGISVAEALSEKTARQLIPNLEDKWVEIYANVALTGKSIRFEENSEAMNRWFDIYGFRTGGAESRNVALLFSDISQRKLAENALHESQEMLSLAMSGSKMGAWSRDLIRDEVDWSPQLEAIFGFSAGTFSGKIDAFYEHVYDSDRDKLKKEIWQALDEHRDYTVEFRFHHKNGDLRWMEGRGQAVYAFDGTPIKVYGIGIDITHRKQAEQERERLLKQLEIERSRLAYLFTKAPAFVATLRGPEHIFELTNPSYIQLIGHRDVIGKTVRESLPEIEGQGFFEILDNVFQKGEPFIGKELPIDLQREPEGLLEKRFLDFVYQPMFGEDDSVTGIFAHGIDITEQVEARREAENANRMKDEFLATLSHELRTPLNAILGWARMLESDQVPREIRAQAIETIVRNARLQSQLIDDILDVSRIISGKMRLEVRPLELSSVIESALESVLPSAQAKEIRIQPVLDSGNSMISGDSNRLQQIIWNLLTNAIKFTPKTGRIQIRLERIESHVEIVVSDSGIGIEPEVLPYIFDRFRQADSATTRKQGGLGLGLAIVRHLVEMHGGTVEAESGGEGKGSTFTVKLPLIAVRSVEIEPEKKPKREHPTADGDAAFDYAPELDGLHVLVAEDENDGRTLVTTVLEKCGAKVTAVNSATAGFTALQELRPDVLISDIGMPDEDGYSLIAKVRALPANQGGNTPAAALTAYARTEDRLKILRSGFQIHLPKPVEPSELIAVVANLVGRIQAV